MQVICIQEEAFYTLIEKVVARIQSQQEKKGDRWKWIDDMEAMKKLSIKSTTTLQKLRDEGFIRFSQPRKKIILYDVDSINEYLEKHAKDTF